MNTCPSIPPEYSTLIACLRGAVNGAPPDTDLAGADWPAVFRQAREQGVDTYLYPWLATHLPSLFSSRATVGGDSAPAAWRAGFLEALQQSTHRKQQLTELLAAIAAAHIDVIPLKGAWLSETVYDDPSQRSMADLDLLIRAADRDACHALFLALGYSARFDTLHSDFACDQCYRNPRHALCVELHWHFESVASHCAPMPDIASIWRHTSPARFLGHPVRLFAPADQVSHLTQHLLHHLLVLTFRSYLDIALYLNKFGEALTADSLESAAARWKTGRANPFIFRLTAELFDFPPPASLQPYLADADTERLAQAYEVLFDLPTVQARDSETTLLRFQQSSRLGRLRLVLSRIFRPRALLTRDYPFARHICLLPYAWFRRACDLRRKNRETIRAILSHDRPGAHPLANTERRADLMNWLLR